MFQTKLFGFILVLLGLLGLSQQALAATFVNNLTPNSGVPAWLDPGWQFWAESDTNFGEAVCIEVHPVGDPGNYSRSQCAFDDMGGPTGSNWRCDVFTGGVPAAFQNATVEYQFLTADFGSSCANNAANFTGFNDTFSTGPTAVSLAALDAHDSHSAPPIIAMLLLMMLVTGMALLAQRRTN